MSRWNLFLLLHVYLFFKTVQSEIYIICINSCEVLFLRQVFEFPYIFQVWYSKLKNILITCCFLLKKVNAYFGDPPSEYMVVMRKLEFIFQWTSSCQQCRTGYNYMRHLFLKITSCGISLLHYYLIKLLLLI